MNRMTANIGATPSGPELTFEEFCGLPMQYTLGFSAEGYGLRMHRNHDFGIQREVYTPRDPRTQSWGLGLTSWFLDFDPREFANVAELYVAWMHRTCGVKEVFANTEAPT